MWHWMQVLRVRSCVAGSHASHVLKDGDLVLAVNSQPVTSYRDVESIVAAASLAAQPLFGPSSAQTPVEVDNQQATAPTPTSVAKSDDKSLLSATTACTSNSSAGQGSTAGTAGAGSADLESRSTTFKLNSSAGTAGAEAVNSKSLSTAGKAAYMPSSQQDGLHLIKAARPDDFNTSQLDSGAEEQQGCLAVPQVSLTIFRAPEVQQVQVQLGSEDGLGTCRLIHWCGAMFQVNYSLCCVKQGCRACATAQFKIALSKCPETSQGQVQ